MRSYKRRKFFIDKRLQSKYILLTVTMLLFYTFALALLIFLPVILPLQFGASGAEQVGAARMLLSLHKTVWPAIGIVILLTGGLTVFISHGVAGPVYRFKKILAEVLAGNLDVEIRLRKYDDLQDLAEALNTMIGDLRGFVQTLKNDHRELTHCIQQLEEKLRSKEIDHVYGEELMKKLQASRDHVAEALDKYSQAK